MVIHIYHSELQLYKVNISDSEASFLDLYLSLSDGSKIYDKKDYFDFNIVMVMFLLRHSTMFIFLNLFNLLGCPLMFMTLILVIKFDSQTSQTRI